MTVLPWDLSDPARWPLGLTAVDLRTTDTNRPALSFSMRFSTGHDPQRMRGCGAYARLSGWASLDGRGLGLHPVTWTYTTDSKTDPKALVTEKPARTGDPMTDSGETIMRGVPSAFYRRVCQVEDGLAALDPDAHLGRAGRGCDDHQRHVRLAALGCALALGELIVALTDQVPDDWDALTAERVAVALGGTPGLLPPTRYALAGDLP